MVEVAVGSPLLGSPKGYAQNSSLGMLVVVAVACKIKIKVNIAHHQPKPKTLHKRKK